MMARLEERVLVGRPGLVGLAAILLGFCWFGGEAALSCRDRATDAGNHDPPHEGEKKRESDRKPEDLARKCMRLKRRKTSPARGRGGSARCRLRRGHLQVK